jgi:hypothetical protein
MWVTDFVSRLIGFTSAECLQSLITLLIASHEPATSSGMNHS